MSVRSKVRVSATVTLLAALAVALGGATGGAHLPIGTGVGRQAGAVHMYPPHTPIIKG